MRRKFISLLIAAAVPVLSHVPAANSQGWPTKPVRLIVPLAAGSTADIVSRTVAVELAKALGQPVVVENKTGAGGTIAMAELARAAPDGYTFGFASQGTLVFNQALYSRPGYDTQKDFSPLAFLGGVSNVMIVPAKSAFRTPGDVAEAARRKPGELTFSSGGSGTSHHLSGVLFAQVTGTQLLHVPYKGAPQGILAVMSEEVNVGFFNTPTVLAQVRDGRLRALAVTSLQRSPLLPDVPTLDEAGVRNYEVNTWFGFVGPAAMPPDVVARFNAEIYRVIALAPVREKLLAQGFDLAAPMPAADFAKLIRDDLAKWVPVVKASGAKVD